MSRNTSTLPGLRLAFPINPHSGQRTTPQISMQFKCSTGLRHGPAANPRLGVDAIDPSRRLPGDGEEGGDQRTHRTEPNRRPLHAAEEAIHPENEKDSVHPAPMFPIERPRNRAILR